VNPTFDNADEIFHRMAMYKSDNGGMGGLRIGSTKWPKINLLHNNM
jgi:hypothetical protein